MINIAITDDQSIIINGLERILSNKPGLKITGTYSNGDELLDALKTQLPDVLLLDIQMPGKSGIEIAGIITKNYPSVRIIALTNFDMSAHVKKMLQRGCQGYLLKDVNPDILVKAIKAVYKGETYIQKELQAKLDKTASAPEPGQVITKREKEILQLIVEEYSNKEIADKLYLSLRTIENHRNHLLQKFNAKNTAGLVKIAIQEGLCE